MTNYTYYHGDGTTRNLKETVQKLLQQLLDGGLTYGEAQCALKIAATELKMEIRCCRLKPYDLIFQAVVLHVHRGGED